jgi:hypothetical protein
MSVSQETLFTRAPRRFYVVGVVALLWNAIGAFDYVMTRTHNAAYMSSFTPEQLDYFYGCPAWVVVAWALAVWGGVAGSVLLLMRKQLAVQVYLVSLSATLLTMLYSYDLSNGMELFGSVGTHVFNALILAVAVGLFMYAAKLTEQGVLR